MWDLSSMLALELDGFWLMLGVLGNSFEERQAQIEGFIESFCNLVAPQEMQQKTNERNIMSKNIAWLFVLLGGICEIFWVSGLKYANTLPMQILTFIGIALSFICAVLAMKKLEVSICYSVFVGIGTGGVVVAEILVFGQEASFVKIALIITLMLGVLGLKLSTKEHTESSKDSHAGGGK